MGYEVLDAGDADAPPGALGGPPRMPDDVGIVPLEPDETWQREEAPKRERAPWPQRWRSRPTWLGGHGSAAADSDRATDRDRDRATDSRPRWASPRPVAAALAAALLLGVLAGSLFTRRHERALQAEAARDQAIVTAEVVDVRTVRERRRVVATVTLRLRNLGPLPLDLATTGDGGRVTAERRVVRPAAGADDVVPAGGTLLAEVVQSLDCNGGRQGWPEVPVRAASGRVHGVRPDEQQSVGAPSDYCRSLDDTSLMVTLEGTLQRPVVRVVNAADRPVSVFVSTAGAPGGDLVSVSARASGPQVVRPQQLVDVPLVIRVSRCEQDLSERSGAQSANSYLEVQAVTVGDDGQELPPDDEAAAEGGQGVDLSGVVGAALERACH